MGEQQMEHLRPAPETFIAKAIPLIKIRMIIAYK
jgi:hypothetical protein